MKNRHVRPITGQESDSRVSKPRPMPRLRVERAGQPKGQAITRKQQERERQRIHERRWTDTIPPHGRTCNSNRRRESRYGWRITHRGRGQPRDAEQRAGALPSQQARRGTTPRPKRKKRRAEAGGSSREQRNVHGQVSQLYGKQRGFVPHVEVPSQAQDRSFVSAKGPKPWRPGVPSGAFAPVPVAWASFDFRRVAPYAQEERIITPIHLSPHPFVLSVTSGVEGRQTVLAPK